jgi:outer membrane protein with beta-barrel domain
MRYITSTFGLMTVCALLGAMPAAAQPLPRFTISVNGGYQPSTTSFDDRFTFDLNRETASVDTDYSVDAGPLFDAGVGFRIWKGLGAGIAISRFSVDSAGQAEATLPHPLFFQRNRQISGETTGITREETGIHIQAQYQLPPFGNVYVTLAGGPSVLDIQQSIVTDVNFTEEFPYDTATYVGVDSQRVSGTATGFNAGADVRWMFTRNVGVGGLVRYTRATVDLTRNNRTVTVDAGGMQVGGGVRLAF